MKLSNNINQEKLIQLISTNDKINIFSSPEIISVFCHLRGMKVFPLAAEENSEIYAYGLGILINTFKWINNKYLNRIVLFASPVYEKNEKGIEGLKTIIEEFKIITKKKALFLEIRNNENTDPKINILFKDFEYLPYQNYLIDLSKGKEEILSSLSSYTRNHITKYIKKGAEIRDIREDELSNGIELIEKLYDSKNIPLFNSQIFYNAYKILKPQNFIKFLVMEYEGKIIGTRIGLAYNRTLYDWYAASLNEYKNFYPNDGLVWNLIEWGIENDYKIFDFGGGALKGEYYGPAKFKEKYKGDLVEFGRYRHIPNKFIFNILEKIYKKFKKD